MITSKVINRKNNTELTTLANMSFIDMHILTHALSHYVNSGHHTNMNHLQAARELYDRVLDIFVEEQPCDSVKIIE